MTRVIPNVKELTLLPIIKANVKHGSIVSTDELKSYNDLALWGFKHGTVNHGAEQWRNGDHCTNTIEGFWSRLKLSIKGTHIHVSKQHLPKYLAEFEFRYNMRGENASLMFDRLLQSF